MSPISFDKTAALSQTELPPGPLRQSAVRNVFDEIFRRADPPSSAAAPKSSHEDADSEPAADVQADESSAALSETRPQEISRQEDRRTSADDERHATASEGAAADESQGSSETDDEDAAQTDNDSASTDSDSGSSKDDVPQGEPSKDAAAEFGDSVQSNAAPHSEKNGEAIGDALPTPEGAESASSGSQQQVGNSKPNGIADDGALARSTRGEAGEPSTSTDATQPTGEDSQTESSAADSEAASEGKSPGAEKASGRRATSNNDEARPADTVTNNSAASQSASDESTGQSARRPSRARIDSPGARPDRASASDNNAPADSTQAPSPLRTPSPAGAPREPSPADAGAPRRDDGAEIAQSSAAANRAAAPEGAGANETFGGRLPRLLVARSDETRPGEPLRNGPDQARFLQRVARAVETAQQRGGEIRLRLNPPELGSLRLEVKVQSGVLTARMEAETAIARDVLMDNLQLLRDRLAEQGIRVEQFDVDLMDRQSGDAAEGRPRGDENQHANDGTLEKPSDSSSADDGDTGRNEETVETIRFDSDHGLDVVV